MNHKWLAAAVEAIAQKDLPRARGLLRAYVTRHPSDARGWQMLSQVAEQAAEENECLRRLLTIKYGPGGARASSCSPLPQAPPGRGVARRAHRASPHHKLIRTMIRAAVCSLTAAVFFILLAAVAPMFIGQRTLVILSGSREIP